MKLKHSNISTLNKIQTLNVHSKSRRFLFILHRPTDEKAVLATSQNILLPPTLPIGPVRRSRCKLVLHQDKGLLKLETALWGGSGKVNPSSENRELVQP